MKPAYYMKFVRPGSGSLDRVGGLPTHLPEVVPTCATTGREMAFLAQFYAHPDRLPLPGVLCVHLYQCLGVDDGEDHIPVVVAVPIRAAENRNQVGVRQPSVVPHEIQWEERQDPDSIPRVGMDESVLGLYKAKTGGAMPFIDSLPSDARALLLLTERPCNLNLAGLCAVLVEHAGGGLDVLLL